MRFLLDQDVPEDLTYLLRELNHEVLRLRDVLSLEVNGVINESLRQRRDGICGVEE